MAFDGQAVLAYHLPTLLEAKTDKGIPLTLKQLEQWLSSLQLLNVEKLSFQIPLYLHKINRLSISDTQRFLILERLRSTVAYLSEAITKKTRNRNLSQESRDVQRQISVLISEMAIGYQRLLFNKAKKKPHIFNRRKYLLLAERALYYLGEQIRVSYTLSMDVPKNIWKDFNASYAFTIHYQLNMGIMKDKFAYHHMMKGSIEQLYNRILLLTMISPYSLRSAELDQVYYGLEQWLDLIKLTDKQAENGHGYVLNLQGDTGAIYLDEILPVEKRLMIDTGELVDKLKTWLSSDIAPESSANKGMSTKLLTQLIDNLDVSKRRVSERLDNYGEQIEVIIGLENIHLFYGCANPEVSGDKTHPTLALDEAKSQENKVWATRQVSGWDSLQFYEPVASTVSKEEQNPLDEIKETTVKRHAFFIENESENGACVSCDNLHDNGLFIGELLIKKHPDAETWTLCVVRWMNVSDNKMRAGLYFLSRNVKRVTVGKKNRNHIVLNDALSLAEGQYGDTLLLPLAEFQTKDHLELNQDGEHLLVTLTDNVWHSQGFAQFKFVIEEIEQEKDSNRPDYLIAD